MTTRRRFLSGLSALALAPVVLAACGSDDTSGSGSGSGDAGSGDSGSTEWETVEIEHKFGTATIEERPTKVAVVGLLEQDMLLALGVAPIATTTWFGEADGRIFPWAQEAFDATGAELPTVLDSADGIPVEEVIGLGPDLIVGIYSGMTEEEFSQLNAFAPTLVSTEEDGDYGTSWEDITLVLGRALGLESEAQEVVDTVNARYAEDAEANAELFEGAQVGVVTPFEGLFIYGPEDTRGRMLAALGFSYPEVLLEQQPEGEFGWSVSEERTTDLAGLDAVVWLDLSAASAGMTRLWEGTDTFEEGRFMDISDADGAYYVAHTMVTPLSIPFVLDNYVPQLVAALDGDPATEPPAPEKL